MIPVHKTLHVNESMIRKSIVFFNPSAFIYINPSAFILIGRQVSSVDTLIEPGPKAPWGG